MNTALENNKEKLFNFTTSHAIIHSYHPDASEPILIRHYDHIHTDPTGIYGYPTKALNTYTLFIFMEGNLHLLIQDSIYTPGFADVIILSRGEPYSLYFHSYSKVEYYEIDFPADFFSYISGHSPFQDYFEDREFGSRNMLVLTDQQKNRMFPILGKLENQMRDLGPYCDYLNYACLLELGVLFSESFSNTTNQINAKSVPSLKEALQYINEHYLTIRSTTEIADHCHISVSYLCRLFKNHLHTTPIDYINSQKLSYAKYLLNNGANTTEACFASGFCNYNYFITTFKKQVGQTPSHFKRNSSAISSES